MPLHDLFLSQPPSYPYPHSLSYHPNSLQNKLVDNIKPTNLIIFIRFRPLLFLFFFSFLLSWLHNIVWWSVGFHDQNNFPHMVRLTVLFFFFFFIKTFLIKMSNNILNLYTTWMLRFESMTFSEWAIIPNNYNSESFTTVLNFVEAWHDQGSFLRGISSSKDNKGSNITTSFTGKDCPI